MSISNLTKMVEKSLNGLKEGKGEIARHQLVTSNFSFSHSDFKKRQARNQDLFVEGLSIKQHQEIR